MRSGDSGAQLFVQTLTKLDHRRALFWIPHASAVDSQQLAEVLCEAPFRTYLNQVVRWGHAVLPHPPPDGPTHLSLPLVQGNEVPAPAAAAAQPNEADVQDAEAMEVEEAKGELMEEVVDGRSNASAAASAAR